MPLEARQEKNNRKTETTEAAGQLITIHSHQIQLQ